ncbi:hypothetical protein [Staphylococcus felis]|uniref:Uncharacterized protein n=1 Tax=Staphylococcus felis TaxID=46127 RepID=A0ABS0QLK5_9STAP|nr:hypothetical protein [Staphylococcus felis]MBH9580103.1 hypothetical protein [Staphylococcus felis]REI09515.1 hypothetical protein DOS69_01890 [Staphylococcus felis]REI33609.1 hypothetical protein DOS82_05795 [Staphylococcus felis]
MNYLSKLMKNVELTLIVVLLLALKISVFSGHLVPTIFLIDNFITVLLVFSALDLYVILKREYKRKYSNEFKSGKGVSK